MHLSQLSCYVFVSCICQHWRNTSANQLCLPLVLAALFSSQRPPHVELGSQERRLLGERRENLVSKAHSDRSLTQPSIHLANTATVQQFSCQSPLTLKPVGVGAANPTLLALKNLQPPPTHSKKYMRGSLLFCVKRFSLVFTNRVIFFSAKSATLVQLN